jgi:hypothetical protein
MERQTGDLMNIRKQGLQVLLMAGMMWVSASLVLAAPDLSNGRSVKYFSGSKQVREITWYKEKRVVRRKTYHRNGRLYLDAVFQNGQPIVKKEYYDNGRLRSIWTAKTQEMKRYSRSGKLERTMTIRPSIMKK